MTNKKIENKDKEINQTNEKFKLFVAPEIYTEELLAFGAACNGTTNGRRKDSTAAPASCNATRLFS